MMKLNLQFFGGRGSGGGKGGSAGGAKSRLQMVQEDAKVQAVMEAANKSWKAGEDYYVADDAPDNSFTIGYEVDEYYNIYQTSDGHVFDDSRVQRMVEGQDSGKYHAWNGNGDLIVTSSAARAAKHAWGTPKSTGYKKAKKG